MSLLGRSVFLCKAVKYASCMTDCFLLSGVSTPTREKEAPGGLFFTAAEQGDARKEVCHHSEGADPAGPAPGGNKVGSE